MDREIILENRRHLNSMREWIGEEDYERSRSHYGCPPSLFHLLGQPIDEQPTCTDVIVAAARRIGHPVSYLEIGVSVGKNLYTLANVLRSSHLFGFDWERINPALERRFERLSSSGRSSQYACGSNRVTYVQGDVFRRDDWRALEGRTFNIIFSDAVHRGEAVRHEFEMLREFGLIDEEKFFLIWDDLDRDPEGPMSRAFREIADAMVDRYGLDDDQAFVVQVNGWLGQHEYRHTVGIVNNIGLSRSDLL